MVADSIIDDIEFSPPAKGSPHKIDVVAPDGLWLITAMVQSMSWFSLRYCAAAVAQRHGFGAEESGFEYPSDRDPGEETFDGVRLYAFDEEMFVSEAAFDRLMLRFFDAMSAQVKATNPPVTAEPWWPDYEASVAAVRTRSTCRRT